MSVCFGIQCVTLCRCCLSLRFLCVMFLARCLYALILNVLRCADTVYLCIFFVLRSWLGVCMLQYSTCYAMPIRRTAISRSESQARGGRLLVVTLAEHPSGDRYIVSQITMSITQNVDSIVLVKKRRRSGATLSIFRQCKRIHRQVSDIVISKTICLG